MYKVSVYLWYLCNRDTHGHLSFFVEDADADGSLGWAHFGDIGRFGLWSKFVGLLVVRNIGHCLQALYKTSIVRNGCTDASRSACSGM
jgi:hypothetical protein